MQQQQQLRSSEFGHSANGAWPEFDHDVERTVLGDNLLRTLQHQTFVTLRVDLNTNSRHRHQQPNTVSVCVVVSTVLTLRM